MSLLRLRGCAGCRKFHHACDELPASADPACDRYESLADWCGRQAMWFDKAERDWMVILAISSLTVAAVAVLTALA